MPLQWEVFVSAQIPVVTNDFPPGASEMKWSPISSTLISGKRDAVLVDTAITVDQNQKLVDWIAARSKNLTTIYATHGHGDHFFGVNTIQKKLLRDTRGQGRPIRRMISKKHENTFATLTGSLPIPGPRRICTSRCSRFIPSA
jgi:glyoxylase-like metal-dependent hydrolase (beta-lactamase superfamily II)